MLSSLACYQHCHRIAIASRLGEVCCASHQRDAQGIPEQRWGSRLETVQAILRIDGRETVVPRAEKEAFGGLERGIQGLVREAGEHISGCL